MSSIATDKIISAILAVHSDIEKRVTARKMELDEAGLWYELSCCVLSSQVRFDLAIAAADCIAKTGALLDESKQERELSDELRELLKEPLSVGDQLKGYRFPNMRADQLSKLVVRVRSEGSDLSGLLNSFSEANDVRNWLVTNAPGIGPKQASMFIRNIYHSFDLAIIDRHVVDYMKIMDLYDDQNGSISKLRNYQKHEAVMSAHASEMGVKVGLLDWAIWIVMRVLKSTEKERVAA